MEGKWRGCLVLGRGRWRKVRDGEWEGCWRERMEEGDGVGEVGGGRRWGGKMERVDEGGWKEWSGLMEKRNGKELVRKWVAWRLVDRG